MSKSPLIENQATHSPSSVRMQSTQEPPGADLIVFNANIFTGNLAQPEASALAIATRMLPLLCKVIGAKPDKVLHAAAHRWRFARVSAPLGLPFLRSDDAALHLGGDWCLGSRVEAAWQSGDAIARDILGGHHAG